MRGAFTVGAMKKIHHTLGIDYFDAIFATSVGVFEQAFFAAGQIDIMENTWREYVHGSQLIKYSNILRGKPVLDLDYLVGLFQSDKSRLDVEAMKNSPTKLMTFMTNYETREPILINLKDGPVFDIMRATCTIPAIYPPKVIVNGRRYVDSWLAPKEKFTKLLEECLEDYDEVMAIGTFKEDPVLDGIKTKKIMQLKPSRFIQWWTLDTNRGRIIETIKQGEVDMERFIIENKLTK